MKKSKSKPEVLVDKFNMLINDLENYYPFVADSPGIRERIAYLRVAIADVLFIVGPLPPNMEELK